MLPQLIRGVAICDSLDKRIKSNVAHEISCSCDIYIDDCCCNLIIVDRISSSLFT